MDEAAPRLLLDLGHLDAAPDELGAHRVGVGDDQLQVVEAAGHDLRQPLADGDRAGRPGRSELHEPDLVAHRVVVVGVEADPLDVELLGPVDIGHGHRHQLELHVHASTVGPSADTRGRWPPPPARVSRGRR